MLDDIPGAFKCGHRFHCPQWPAISDWVSTRYSEDQWHVAWTTLGKDWLEHLRSELSGDYAIHESTNFLLLSNQPARQAKRLLEHCEYACQTILRTLDGVARDEGYGKHVVLWFSDMKTYYDYLADFYPEEGEFALSGGVCLNEGYRHMALCQVDDQLPIRTVAHELNHVLLSHLPLPMWLNEGVTQVMEDIVVDASNFFVSPELACEHRNYWNEMTIQQFWDGNSFASPDEGQRLSYHLAQILVRNLMSDYPKQMLKFLASADQADAGNAALQKLCRITLGQRVKQFLGAGDWEPRVDAFRQSGRFALVTVKVLKP